MARVSVIIPTYNRCQLLREAIASVLAQDFADFELLVIDDGSNDGTRYMVKDLKDERCRYFYKPNGGVSSARNLGLTKAGGDYIAFLDSDDLWPKEYLEVMVSALEDAPGYGVGYCSLTNVYSDGRIVREYRAKSCVSGWVTRPLFNKFFVACQATVIRRLALNRFYFDENLKTAEDIDLFLRLSLDTRFLFVPVQQVVRRVKEGSLSQHKDAKRINVNRIRVLERFYYDLGGKRIIPKMEAMRRIGETCRRIGSQYCKMGAYKAGVFLFKRAISYNRFDFGSYCGLMKGLIKSKCSEAMPDWRFPEPLPLINGKQL